MLEIPLSVPNEFDHPLAVITTIGMMSLVYCQMTYILNGNGIFLGNLFERDRVKVLRRVITDKCLDWILLVELPKK